MYWDYSEEAVPDFFNRYFSVEPSFIFHTNEANRFLLRIFLDSESALQK